MVRLRIRSLLVLLGLSLVFSFSACQSSEIPAGSSSPLAGTVQKDVIYSSSNGADLRLDIHYPNLVNGPIPTVVYVHGGEGGTRTPTPFEAHDPKSCSSANSDTSP